MTRPLEAAIRPAWEGVPAESARRPECPRCVPARRLHLTVCRLPLPVLGMRWGAIGNGNKCTAFINGKKAVHICRRVGKQEYTLGPAANSNAEGPCTNRPVKCEHCSTLLLDSAVLLDGGALPEVAWHGGDEHEAKEGGGARGARA